MKWFWTVPLLALAASAILAGAEQLPPLGSLTSEDPAEAPSVGFGPKNYSAQFTELDRKLMLAQERRLRSPDQWLARATLAEAALARFRLTRDTDDLVMSGKELAAAQELAPVRSGPLLSSADYSMAIHDLSSARVALDTLSLAAVPLNDDIQSEIAAMRADIAFYRGDSAKAATLLGEANNLAPAPGTFVRQAHVLRSTGKFDPALENLNRAATFRLSRSPFAVANLSLQSGMVESARGNYPAARKLFQQANDIFPGYWLNQLYLAEAQAVSGNHADAISELLRLAKSTGYPEVMDALAMMYRASGDRANSILWSSRAGTLWRKRVARLPTAYAGHAAEHELVFGKPSEAVKLARTNLAARPNGEARILLANALMANGQFEPALVQLRLAEKSGWRSAPLYAALAQAKASTGDSDGAQQAELTAKSLNPQIFDAATRFIWFAHG